MEQNDRLTIKAKEVISSPLKAKLRVAVAVSGGKDSTCLLHFLLNNYDKNLFSEKSSLALFATPAFFCHSGNISLVQSKLYARFKA